VYRTLSAVVGVTAALLAAASASQTQCPPGLTGDWHLRPAAPRRPGPGGIQLTLTIDSVREAQVFGHLVHYFSGNVGIDPARFRPFEGSRSDDALAIAIEPAEPAGPGIRFAGRVSGDTIHLTTFALGTDTLSHDTAWMLVRGDP
jgi:hypothetical protein